MKIVCLAGGVGGAKLAFGLAHVLPPADLTIVVNTGDDFTHLGLRISPDLDTVTYTLAGLANPDTGWGLAGDTSATLDALERLGAPSWFHLGDRDIATHLLRTQLLTQGMRLTEVTSRICEALGVAPAVLPMTDDTFATRVVTDEGELDFQDYFVRRRCEPRVARIIFAGGDTAQASGEVLRSLDEATGVVFAPSNPFVSVEPILSLPGVRERIGRRAALAVSPIVGGQAIKGPAAKMLFELGLDVSPAGVAVRYAGLIGGFVMDEVDAPLAPSVAALGPSVRVAQTVMRSDAERESLARECLAFLKGLRPELGAS
ncbi:MAG TPA: 2-phospho-L-lactate transferase [Dehalococcoidia bacterium]|nr:2-phospho-L-lactate transferase [Dehalococcoidia bacterium]